MSLTKALQKQFAPINIPWVPPHPKELSRFINEIVLAEESDITPEGSYSSHFEMYCIAMSEIQSNPQKALDFTEKLKHQKPRQAALSLKIPLSAQNFMNHTFSLINNSQIHKVAAAFCFGREQIIPSMFLSLLNKMNIQPNEAPMFHYYLKRHIEIDSESHGPLALKLLSHLCGEDPKKWSEVEEAGVKSLQARIHFWNQICEELGTDEEKNYQPPYSPSSHLKSDKSNDY